MHDTVELNSLYIISSHVIGLKGYTPHAVYRASCPAREVKRAAARGDAHPSLFKLLHKLFHLGAVGVSTYAESRPTSSVLGVRHDALHVLHVWTRAVYGLSHAHEGVWAEVFRAGNCQR
jgi:hypothetical protein